MTEITYDDIKKLNASQLQELLNIPIYSECYQYKFSPEVVTVTRPDRIAIKDGSADVIVEIPNRVEGSRFFSPKIIYQAKAENLRSLKKELNKKSVEDNIKNGWGYVLFCNKIISEGWHFRKLKENFKKEIADKTGIDIEEIQFELYSPSEIARWIEDYKIVASVFFI